MKPDRTIRKLFIVAAGVLVLASLATLLVAARHKGEANVCRGVRISILPGEGVHYVDEEQVLLTIEKQAGSTLINRPVAELNLGAMERAVEENVWIKDAQLYFDSRQQLHVVVEERRPIARFITTAGTSFYIDDEGTRLAFIGDKPIRLQVVTGFTAAKKWNHRDSGLFEQTRELVAYINHHPFWNAQVGQVDITPQGSFELVPVIGNSIIRLGTTEDAEEKFNKLFLFYQQVLRKTGFNKYEAIDVQYDGQVVAVKKGNSIAVDSLQLKKNIDDFLKQKEAEQLAEAALNNTDFREDNRAKAPAIENTIRSSETERTQVNKTTTPVPAASAIIPEKPSSLSPSVPVKTKTNPKKNPTPVNNARPVVIKKDPEENESKQPKAVMPKKEETDQQN